MRLPAAIAVLLTLCAAAGAEPTRENIRALRSLSAQLGLETAGETSKCGFPLTSYVFEHARRPERLEGIDAAAFLARPVTQVNILAGPFRIHFDTSGTHEPALLDDSFARIAGSARAYAESVAAVTAFVLEKEVAELGYPPAPPDGGAGGGTEYDIYIQDLDPLGFYGRTVPEQAGHRSTTYLEIDNDFLFVIPDSLKGLPALRVTLAHEYHHAIQIGNYGLWGFEHRAYYEMTSVWMEDVVFPEVNDYFSYLFSSTGHFRRPEVPFTSNDFIMYSRGIWCHYLARRFGPDVIRLSWEFIATLQPIPALQAALAQVPYNSSFRDAFAEWTLWNAFTAGRADTARYYPEGAAYPRIRTRTDGFTPPSLALPDTLPPLGARYHEVLFYADTVVLPVVNLDVASALAGDLVADPYTVFLATSRVDDTYRETAPGLFLSLGVAEPGLWYVWDIVNGGVRPAPLVAGTAYPNPFRPGRHPSVFIPVGAASPVTGTLSVFSPDMNLVHRSEAAATLVLGNYGFRWDGRGSDGSAAGSGVYFYVLDLPEGRRTGKFALIRE